MKSINNTRHVNRKKIIEHVLYSSTGASQQQIKDQLNLDNSTIKRICDTLLDEGILLEQTQPSTGKGRRPKLYTINKDFASALVIILGTKHTEFLLYNADLSLKTTDHITYDRELGIIEKLELIKNAITKYNVKIGYIVTSGTIDNDNRTILNSSRLMIENFPIAEYFEESFDFPFFVENNMNTAALRLSKLNDHNTEKNFAVISAGSGLGAGFIVDQKLYRGYSGNAGEIGHLYYKQSDKDCYCKRNGCFELFFSSAIFDNYNINITTVEQFAEYQKSSPIQADEIICKLAEYGAHLLRNIDVILNIDKYYVTGLIFEILLTPDNLPKLTSELSKNKIDTELKLLPYIENHFHLGGAILATDKIFNL